MHYKICDGFQVVSSADGFSAVSCGFSYGLGSLHTTKHMPDPKTRLQIALEAAADFSAGAAEPFNFVNA